MECKDLPKRGCDCVSTSDLQLGLEPNISPSASLSCFRNRRLWSKLKWIKWSRKEKLNTNAVWVTLKKQKCYLSTLTSQQMTTSSSCPSVSLRLTIFKRGSWWVLSSPVWMIVPGFDVYLIVFSPCLHYWWHPHWAYSSLVSPPCLQREQLYQG